MATDTAVVASRMTLQTGTLYALTGLTSTVQWATAGFVTAAKCGLDYRKMKKGELTKEQFDINVKKYTMMGAGSVIGSITGMAAGFAAGSLIFPGIGSIVGAVAGAIGGGIAGQKLSLKAFASIEEQIAEMKKRDQLKTEQMAWDDLRY